MDGGVGGHGCVCRGGAGASGVVGLTSSPASASGLSSAAARGGVASGLAVGMASSSCLHGSLDRFVDGVWDVVLRKL